MCINICIDKLAIIYSVVDSLTYRFHASSHIQTMLSCDVEKLSYN